MHGKFLPSAPSYEVLKKWYTDSLSEQGVYRALCYQQRLDNDRVRGALERSHDMLRHQRDANTRLQARLRHQLAAQSKIQETLEELRIKLKNSRAINRTLNRDQLTLQSTLDESSEYMDYLEEYNDKVADVNQQLANLMNNVREKLQDEIDHSSTRSTTDSRNNLQTVVDSLQLVEHIVGEDSDTDEDIEEDESGTAIVGEKMKDIMKNVVIEEQGSKCDTDCPICLSSFSQGQSRTTLQCGHMMHDSCCAMYFSMSNTSTCPMCRHAVWKSVEDSELPPPTSLVLSILSNI